MLRVICLRVALKNLLGFQIIPDKILIYFILHVMGNGAQPFIGGSALTNKIEVIIVMVDKRKLINQHHTS